MVMLPFAALRRQPFDTGCQRQLPSVCSPITAPLKSDLDFMWGQSQIVCDVEIEAVGAGAFGTVRRARLVSDGRTCVVKEVLKRNVGSEAAARREAEILRCLNHKSICQLLGSFEDDRAIYLVLEYIDGHDLFEELAEAGGVPMDEVRVAHIARQVFEALKYLHESVRSVLHRDLKLENVMLSKNALNDKGMAMDDVKLIDFGLGVVCKDNIQTSLVGTPGYIAPESLEKGFYSQASDMWSTGAMLHMLLTGGLLPVLYHTEDDRVSLDVSSLEQAGVSKAAKILIESLLAARPQDRPTAAEAAMDPWIICGGCDKHNRLSCPLPVTSLRTTGTMQHPSLTGT